MSVVDEIIVNLRNLISERVYLPEINWSVNEEKVEIQILVQKVM